VPLPPPTEAQGSRRGLGRSGWGNPVSLWRKGGLANSFSTRTAGAWFLRARENRPVGRMTSPAWFASFGRLERASVGLQGNGRETPATERASRIRHRATAERSGVQRRGAADEGGRMHGLGGREMEGADAGDGRPRAGMRRASVEHHGSAKWHGIACPPGHDGDHPVVRDSTHLVTRCTQPAHFSIASFVRHRLYGRVVPWSPNREDERSTTHHWSQISNQHLTCDTRGSRCRCRPCTSAHRRPEPISSPCRIMKTSWQLRSGEISFI
jgi:hypothetical protein